MSGLQTWIAKHISYRLWPQKVSINGVEFVPLSLAEQLFDANQKLAGRFTRERKRRKAAEAARGMHTDGGTSHD